MPARFAETINALKKGAEKMTAAAAVKNIEGWEKSVGELDTPAAKTLLKDLGDLKEALQEDKTDGKAVQKLVAKLGKETLAIAKKSEGAMGEKLEELGSLLSEGTKAAA